MLYKSESFPRSHVFVRAHRSISWLAIKFFISNDLSLIDREFRGEKTNGTKEGELKLGGSKRIVIQLLAQ